MGKNPIMEKSDAGAACLSWTFFSIILSVTIQYLVNYVRLKTSNYWAVLGNPSTADHGAPRAACRSGATQTGSSNLEWCGDCKGNSENGQISWNIIKYQECHHALGFVKFDLKLKPVKVIQSRHSCHKPISYLQRPERRLFEKPEPQRFNFAWRRSVSFASSYLFWNLGIFDNIWQFSLFDRFARTSKNISIWYLYICILVYQLMCQLKPWQSQSLSRRPTMSCWRLYTTVKEDVAKRLKQVKVSFDQFNIENHWGSGKPAFILRPA